MPTTRAPTVTNVNTSEVYGTSAIDLANMVITDDSATSTLTVVLSLVDISAGAFTTVSGVTLSENGTVATIVGKASEVNTALAALGFTPVSGYTATFAINVRVSDDDTKPNIVVGSKLMNFVSDGDDTVRIDSTAQTPLPISGGKGSDTLIISDAQKGLSINLNAAADAVQVIGVMGKYTNFEHINAAGVGTVLTVLAHSGGSMIVTGSASDKIVLNAGKDVVSTGAGNDSITGALSAGDEIDLGAGNETFTHSDASGAIVDGGAGNDTLLYTGASSATLVINGAGAGTSYYNFETLSAGRASGNITATAGGPVVTIATGKGNDTIDVSAAKNGVAINAGSGTNSITGSAFADTITLGTGVDTVLGGDGSDVIVGKLSAGDSINLQAGKDVFTLQAMSTTTVDGGDDVDTLIISAAKLALNSMQMQIDLAAQDTQQVKNEASGAVYKNFENLDASKLRIALHVSAAETTTLILTGKAADTIDASAAKAAVTINGGGGADSITGSDFNDTIVWQSMTDASEAFQTAMVDAGDGTDTLVYAGAVEKLFDFTLAGDQVPSETGSYKNFENLYAANATGRIHVVAAAGTTAIATGKGIDNIDASRAAQGVSINGGNGTNTITGSAYGDAITLGSGVDTIYAGAGDDIFTGAPSIGDQIKLQTGNDSISYASTRRGTVVDGGEDTDTLVYAGAARTFNFNNSNNVTGEEGLYQNFENLAASAATGNLIVVASAATTSIATGAGNDTLTGAAGSQRLQGGGGNDTLNGVADGDTFVFEESGAKNGSDSIGGNFAGGTSGDVLDFSAFLNGGSFSASVIEHDANSDVAIANRVVLLATADGDTSVADSVDKIAAMIEGSGNAMSIVAGGKAVIIAGDDSAVTPNARIYYVDDSVGENKGVIEADDLGLISTLTVDIDTIVTANIDLTAGGISYSASKFQEAAANNGSITSKLTITVTGDTFSGAIGSSLGTVSNVPAGLTAVLIKTSDTTASLGFTGAASSHGSAQDIANLTVSFSGSDFTSGNTSTISGLVKNNLAIDFDDPLPTFTVTDTSGVLTFGGSATGNISVLIDSDNIASFTRSGIVASTKADLDTVSKITIASGQALVLSAAVANGMTVDGAGTLNLMALHSTLDADLSKLTVASVNAAFDDDGIFTGELGKANVTVATTKTLTISADKAAGKTIGGAGSTAITGFVVTDEYALAGVSSAAGTVSFGIGASGTLHANTTLNGSATMTLANAVTLTGTAEQLHGIAIVDGADTADVVITALDGADFDGSEIDISGALVYEVLAGGATLAANTVLAPMAAASTTVNIADASTLTASAAQLEAVLLVAAGAGNVVITGATGAQTVTATGGDDVLAGGEGDDVLNGAGGADIYVFEQTGALNGKDTISFVPADDVLDLSAFLAGGMVALDGVALDVIAAATGNAQATDTIFGFDDGGAALTEEDLAALFKTTDSTGNNVFALDDNGKTVIIHGDGGGATRAATIYFVDAALDGNGTDVTAADIVIVGVTSANLNLSILTAANFDLVA